MMKNIGLMTRRLIGAIAVPMLAGCATTPTIESRMQSANEARDQARYVEAAEQYKSIADGGVQDFSGVGQYRREAEFEFDFDDEGGWKYGVLRYQGAGDLERDLEEAVKYMNEGSSYFENNQDKYTPTEKAVYDAVINWKRPYETGSFEGQKNANKAYKLLQYYHAAPGTKESLDPDRLELIQFWAERAEVSRIERREYRSTFGEHNVEVVTNFTERILDAVDALDGGKLKAGTDEPTNTLAEKAAKVANFRGKHPEIEGPGGDHCREPVFAAYWSWIAARNGHLPSQYRMSNLYDYDSLPYQYEENDFRDGHQELINCWTRKNRDKERARKWLVQAANNGHEEAMRKVRTLAQREDLGASPAVPDPDLPEEQACYIPNNKTAQQVLTEAVKANDAQLARCMAERDANIDARNNSEGPTHLHRAIRLGSLDVARVLLRNGADTSLSDNGGRRPLHVAVAEGKPDMIELLLQERDFVDLNAVDADGRTPLHRAAEAGNRKSVSLLLEAGADPNIQAIGGTPRAVAKEYGHPRIAKLLAKRGGDDISCLVDKEHVFEAARFDNVDKGRCLFSNGIELQVRNASGETALHIAAESGSQAFVEWMLKQDRSLAKLRDHGGVTPLTRDHGGQTPLHVAGDVSVAKTLLEYGAPTDVTDKRGLTPRLAAIRNLSFAVAQTIRRHARGKGDIDEAKRQSELQNVLHTLHEKAELFSRAYSGQGNIIASGEHVEFFVKLARTYGRLAHKAGVCGEVDESSVIDQYTKTFDLLGDKFTYRWHYYEDEPTIAGYRETMKIMDTNDLASAFGRGGAYTATGSSSSTSLFPHTSGTPDTAPFVQGREMIIHSNGVDCTVFSGELIE